ncbi:MAG: serine/threonine protein kinase [Thiohalospira sp.]
MIRDEDERDPARGDSEPDSSDETPYADLGPDTVLDAVAALGYSPDGRLLPLNSYENRVYRVGLEEGPPLVAKFYRPGRWSSAAIREEHAFAAELAAAEIPVVAPLEVDRTTLPVHAGYRFAIFPNRGGRPPELDDPEVLERIGHFMGRLHGVGAGARFEHRPALEPATFGERVVERLCAGDWIPPHMEPAYTSVTRDLLDAVNERWEAVAPRPIRLHGDAHPGNILWRDGPHIVDLDDARTGPAIQDLWLFLGGERGEQEERLRHLWRGYRAFHDLDPVELGLVEALRALRLIHHAGWIAARWGDPAFPRAFPWFDSPRYWEEHVLALREQLAALGEPALPLPMD